MYRYATEMGDAPEAIMFSGITCKTTRISSAAPKLSLLSSYAGRILQTAVEPSLYRTQMAEPKPNAMPHTGGTVGAEIDLVRPRRLRGSEMGAIPEAARMGGGGGTGK